MEQITKEQLSKENSKLAQRVNELENRLSCLQKEFSQVFNGYPQVSLYSFRESAKIMTWEEIFFRIGGLNSDADYTILLEQKHLLQNELNQIKEKKVAA